MSLDDLRAREVLLGDVHLHVLEAGSGPLVVLLHGFPDHWRVWRHQIEPLAAAGFRVVAPDMRGYDRSDKPHGLEAYRLDVLARDVAALIEQLGGAPAAVVGHDWGGVVAWQTALRYPEHVRRLVVMNAPHPFVRLPNIPPDQWLKSWYIGFFQLPLLPEAALSAFDYAILRESYRHESSRPGATTPEDVEESVRALARPGALTAALNYYRALALQPPPVAREQIELPVQILWGDRDPFLGPGLAAPPPGRVPNARVLHRREAGHWIMLDEPRWVLDQMIPFLQPTLDTVEAR